MKKRVVSGIKGLTTAEAFEKQRKFGKNVLTSTERNHLWESLKHIALEPMFLLLAVACTLYFILGDLAEAVMMLVSIAFVAGIEVYQETKSEKALEALRRYTEAQVRVLRDGAWTLLPAEELVPGDVVEAGEGDHIPADGIVLEQHDLSVDESILTGESLAVDKNVKEGHNLLYQGTTVASGSGVFRVSTIGNNTELGKLGKSIEQIDPPATPLQLQLERFVKQIGLFGILAFALVFFLNLALSHDFWMAILFSLTIA
ncbi:MAG: HAD-IC family P-type ATPase, partial [Saprospiraceae bacterium]|nr:HAD-IC family P-type ATPase [Saprospiraceae bacterium]